MTNTRRGLWKSFVIELSEHLRKKEVEKLKWIFDLPGMFLLTNVAHLPKSKSFIQLTIFCF